MKAKQNILFGVLLGIVIISTRFLWNPWRFAVPSGLLGIFYLRGAMILWRKAKMIYIAISYTVLSIVFLVVFLQSLIMHSVSWSFIIFPAIFVLLFMIEVERRKNPNKVEKYESAWKRVSFFELITFKYLADLEDKKKPEKKK